MPNTIIDDVNDLVAGNGFLHLMQAADTGTTFIGIAMASATLGGLEALGKQRVVLASGAGIQAQLGALHLAGNGSGVTNEGTIASAAGPAIRFTGGGSATVTNLGTITAAAGRAVEIGSSAAADRLDLFNGGTVTAGAVAVVGGQAGDRVVNTGTLATTDATPGALAVDLGAGNDFYDGAVGAITGFIRLGAGQDTAFGGAGDETFLAGDGADVIDGGRGMDRVDYSASATALTVNLTNASQANGDTLANVENIFGSAFADSLTGSGGVNHLSGGGGDDTLEGGFGNDTLEGGDGQNTARFGGANAANVDLTKVVAQDTGYGTDLLTGIRHVEAGSAADALTGDGADNRLTGNGGNDTLKGGAGSDTLLGGAGNDTLEGGAGNDSIEGGTGQNTVVYSGASTDFVIAQAEGVATVTDRTGAEGVDTVKEARFLKFSDKTVALVNSAPTSLFPSSASVTENTAAGSTLATFFGADPDGDAMTYSLVFSDGDLFGVENGRLVVKGVLDYEAASQRTVTVRASDPYGGELVKTITVSVRNAVETTPISRKGTSAAEQLVGEAGGDRLQGMAGNDTLFGEAGNDTLIGGAGNDGLLGGKGRDVFVFDARLNTGSNLDTVYDFDVRDDTIHLARSVFSKIGRKGVLSKDAFVVGDRVLDKEDRIIHLKKQGALFYDPDGTGSAKAVQFATIGKNLKMTAADFFVI